jgi:hypothetical protein
MLSYQAGDIEQSLLSQEKATVIFERVVGLDHYETAHSYVYLYISILSFQLFANIIY